MITFYKNETDVIFELEPLEGYPYYSRITVGYCNFDKELSPNDLYFQIEYASSNTGDINRKTVRYIIKNANDDNYIITRIFNEFIPYGEDYTYDKVFCSIFNTTTFETIGEVGGSGYMRISELPTKLYLGKQTNNSNIFSNNTLYKYGILRTLNNIISTINCVVVNDDIPHIKIKITEGNFLYGVQNVYGILENTPKGKEFVGFTFNPFSNKVDVKLGTTIINDYIYNLYPVYDYIKTPTEENLKTSIICYKNSAEDIRVSKQDYLTNSTNFPDEIPITFLDDCDIIRPLISLVTDGKSIDFNYVYLKPLNRYYFIEDVVYKSNNIVELILKIDILMTYKNSIYELYGFIDRNEFEHTTQIIDDKRVVYSGYDVSSTTIQTDLFKPRTTESGATVPPQTLYVTGFDIFLEGD